MENQEIKINRVDIFNENELLARISQVTMLKNPETNGYLELDGYCSELNLAFEYNGPQHYKIVPEFHLKEARKPCPFGFANGQGGIALRLLYLFS